MTGVNAMSLNNNDVVKLSKPESTIALVSLEDRMSKNTFSKVFVQGLLTTFNKIKADKNIKVVVIHGYDNFFCCGGTQEELLGLAKSDIHDKNFTNLSFYRLLLDCEIPVISAMQGHALGGGLAFGAFADTLVMGLESFYATNFMKYGFTPGFGSTYIIPKKFGKSVADSMLFSARNYQGIKLQERGVSAVFVKKTDVIATALNMAKEITKNSRESLVALKDILTKEDKLLLPKYIEDELAMHEISFKLPEVVTRINQLFGR